MEQTSRNVWYFQDLIFHSFKYLIFGVMVSTTTSVLRHNHDLWLFSRVRISDWFCSSGSVSNTFSLGHCAILAFKKGVKGTVQLTDSSALYSTAPPVLSLLAIYIPQKDDICLNSGNLQWDKSWHFVLLLWLSLFLNVYEYSAYFYYICFLYLWFLF